MFIRSWLLTVCGDFPQIGGQVSMRRMSLAAVSLLNQVRTVVAFLLVIMIALHPYVVRALPLPNARGPLDRKLFAINVLLRRNCGVNLLDCTTTRFVLWIDAPRDVAPQRLPNSRYRDEGGRTTSSEEHTSELESRQL